MKRRSKATPRINLYVLVGGIEMIGFEKDKGGGSYVKLNRWEGEKNK